MSKINVTSYIIDAGEKLSGRCLVFLSDFMMPRKVNTTIC